MPVQRSGEREPLSTRCDSGVQQAARDTVAGMLAHDPSFSMTTLVEQALIAEVERLSIEHNGGQPWPRSAGLRRGRRTA